jgi:hypothetical protein
MLAMCASPPDREATSAGENYHDVENRRNVCICSNALPYAQCERSGSPGTNPTLSAKHTSMVTTLIAYLPKRRFAQKTDRKTAGPAVSEPTPMGDRGSLALDLVLASLVSVA